MGGEPGEWCRGDGTHTCTRVLTHTEALSHACLHLHTTIPTANVVCTHPYVYPRTARHVYTHITHVLTPKALPTQSCRCRAGYVHIHVPGFTHTILSFANAHTIHACAHTSYVGLCQRAHTHRLHTIPYKCLPGHACAGTRTTQIPRALPELVGQPPAWMVPSSSSSPSPQRTLNSGQ